MSDYEWARARALAESNAFKRVRDGRIGGGHDDTVLAAGDYFLRDELTQLREAIKAGRPDLLATMDRFGTEWIELLSQARILKNEVRPEIEKTRALLSQAEAQLRSTVQRATSQQEELDRKTSDLRDLRDQIDPSARERYAQAAVERACADRDAEMATLRARVAELQSETAQLKAAKKKLRDALERAKEAANGR